MNRFTFTKLGRTLLMLTAVTAFGLLGCGGDDNQNNNGGGGGEANHDSRLVCGKGEAWLHGSSCASADLGHIYKSNGVAMQVRPNDGVWSVTAEVTWRTDGNKLTLNARGQELSGTYEISNGTLITTDDDGPHTFKKCGGLTIIGQ